MHAMTACHAWHDKHVWHAMHSWHACHACHAIHGMACMRGMLSMPSKNIENPYKKASPFEFFIVQQQAGAHHLDGDYTIFGKVINGMDVVDTIADVPTDSSDWPLQNVFIKKIEILK